MFPNNLRKLRESKGLTYRELSDVLSRKYNVKFSKSTIERWEKGESSPTITHASAIAHYFGITLDELSGIKELPEIKEEKKDFSALAAHIREDATEEEIREIQNFIDYTFSTRDDKE